MTLRFKTKLLACEFGRLDVQAAAAPHRRRLAAANQRSALRRTDRRRDIDALAPFDPAWATPYLRVTSATPDSAKSLLLEILASISRRGWHAVKPSAAVLYRKVNRDAPTLLLDEMDNYPLDDRRDALSILNAGLKRGVTVPRCKENGDLEEFKVFCPKA
jgi:hypothetical protein